MGHSPTLNIEDRHSRQLRVPGHICKGRRGQSKTRCNDGENASGKTLDFCCYACPGWPCLQRFPAEERKEKRTACGVRQGARADVPVHEPPALQGPDKPRRVAIMQAKVKGRTPRRHLIIEQHRHKVKLPQVEGKERILPSIGPKLI